MTQYRRIVCLIALGLSVASPSLPAQEAHTFNLINNGDFQGEIVDDLPKGWTAHAARPSLAPEFRLVKKQGQRCLYATGGGNPDCAGWVSTRAEITRGKTYWFRVRFRKSRCLNPLQHLLFDVTAGDASQQITEFHRLKEGWVEGESRVSFPGEGNASAEVRILYRLCAKGKLWVQNISLVETDPVEPRWVRVACTQGPGSLEDYGLPTFRKALDVAGQGNADLALLPEYINGELVQETLSGPSVQLMSEKAKQYGMYVAGTIALYDEATDRLTNSALLFDREGKLVGRYDKVHLYAPELNRDGVTPGDRVPVFRTDFGRVGFMTCYDSWFTDVAELVALQGADLLLFPNLGYDRELMHARSLDNRINVVASSRSGRYGVWDSAGRDIISASLETGSSFKNILEIHQEGGLGVLMVTLDLNTAQLGGLRLPAPRTKRYWSNQRIWLEPSIARQKQRWWVD